MDCFAFIQLTFGNTSLKRDFEFASSHLEDLNMKYTANTNRNKTHVNGSEGNRQKSSFSLLMEKQSSCSNLLIKSTVLARSKTYTLKQTYREEVQTLSASSVPRRKPDHRRATSTWRRLKGSRTSETMPGRERKEGHRLLASPR